MKQGIMTFCITVLCILPVSISQAYTVKPGDRLSTIANKQHLTIQQILALNPNITEPNKIYVGQTLTLKNNKVTSLTSGERRLLAQLIHAEASGEPFNGKVKVAQVVFNRVKSTEFPNSIKEVIMQEGQFSPIANGAINNIPTEIDYKALDTALNQKAGDDDDGSLYFFNPEIAESQWLSSLETTTVIGHHVFKK